MISTLDTLLDLEDESFVGAAYQWILRRQPDPEGFAHYLRHIRQGTPKLQILAQIRTSTEGSLADSLAMRELDAAINVSRRDRWGFLKWWRRPSAEEKLQARLNALGNMMYRHEATLLRRLKETEIALTSALSQLPQSSGGAPAEKTYSVSLGSIGTHAQLAAGSSTLCEQSRHFLEIGRGSFSIDGQRYQSIDSNDPQNDAVVLQHLGASSTPDDFETCLLTPVSDTLLNPSQPLYWVSTGTDPHFALQLSTLNRLREGWIAIEMLIESEASGGMAKLYLNVGEGYDENNVIKLPYFSGAKILRPFLLNKKVVSLRFDPREDAGAFRVDCLRFHSATQQFVTSLITEELASKHFSYTGLSKPDILVKIDALAEKNETSLSLELHHAYEETLKPRQGPVGYNTWISEVERLSWPTKREVVKRVESMVRPPLISILLPTYNTPEKLLRECVESIVRQSYQHWELCIADDASTAPHVRAILTEYLRQDTRIKVAFRPTNGHISRSSNTALEQASGDFVALVDHDDLLPEHALYFVAIAIDENPDAILVYSDEDKLDAKGARFEPHFKSDWNPDLLLSQNYISHLGVYRRDTLGQMGGFKIGVEGSQDHDLLLRLFPMLSDKNVVHVPRILYHWRAAEGSTALNSQQKEYTSEASIKSLNDLFASQNMKQVRVKAGIAPNTYRISYPIPKPSPLVSLLIPTRDRAELLETCVRSILRRTTYRNFEIIILDNGSIESETLQFFKQIVKDDSRVKVLQYNHPFNYSAINNFGVNKSRGSIIGLINNDIEVISECWLEEMVSHACRPGIGCVGAKLYYKNNTIQHAGVILGIGGVAGHSHKYFERSSPGYFSRLLVAQDVSAVTAACLIVRKEIYLDVGGLDELALKVAFNDVDFCLKVRRAGYRNLWTPFAELYHYESISRGTEDTPAKQARFNTEVECMKSRWADFLRLDPYYSPNLSTSREDFSYGLSDQRAS